LAGIKRRDFAPFGEELSAGAGIRSASLGYGPDSTRQKFTGKERDNETSLDYFLARYYSSTQGRFTSPDIPFADQSEGDPQSWNLYAYVGNNPLKYIDPFGMWKQVSCGDGNCWEAEEGDTLKTLAKQSGIGLPILNWAFSGTAITPGETVISTTGVKEDFRAWADEVMRQMPLFEPGIGGGIIKRFGPGAARAVGNLISRINRPTKPANLPNSSKVTIDMVEVTSGHMSGGVRAAQNAAEKAAKRGKDMFPDWMTPAQAERAILDAYTHSQIISVQGERVLLRGVTKNGSVIEMYFNRTTRIIETAWPKGRVSQ
jgi:RHS repeat-associated protein